MLRRSVARDIILNENVEITDKEIKFTPVSEKLLSLYGIDTIISSLPLKQGNFTLIKELKEDTRSVYAYHNPAALPRAYLTTTATTVETLDEAKQKLLSPDFAAGKDVLIEQHLSQTPAPVSGKVMILSEGQTELNLEIRDIKTKELLIVTDSFYPGWEAFIDQEKTPIYIANISQRAVEVPTGDHLVKFVYRPQSLRIGASVSGVSHVFILVILASWSVSKIRRLRRYK
jgi:uncharacterized membrane protein YfhO